MQLRHWLLRIICVSWFTVFGAIYYGQLWNSLWGDPQYSVVLSLLGALSLLLAAEFIGIALSWLLRWRPENWREAISFQLSMGLGFLSYTLLMLARLHAYTASNIRTLVMSVLAIGGTVWIVHKLVPRILHVHSVPASGFPGRVPITLARTYTRERCWMLISVTAMGMALFAALAPETEWDALTYHLWLPKLWLQRGGSVDLPWEPFSLFPLTWELLFGAGLSLGGPVAAKLLHFCCLPLISVIVYEMTRRYFPGTSYWLAVALFVTIPSVFWEATTAYVDLALTLHITLALFAVFKYVECRRWQWLVLSASNIGLALATKHHALLVLAFATVYLAVKLWLQDRRLSTALGLGAVLFTGSLLLPAPWYYRSWRASGNPVFPLMFTTFGAQPPTRWDAKIDKSYKERLAERGRPRSLSSYLSLPWDMTVHATLFEGSFGPAFLLLMPGLLVKRRRVLLMPLIASFTISYFLFWASPIGSFQFRYLLPVTPLLAVLAAEATERLSSIFHTYWRGFLNWCIGIVLVLNLPPLISLQEVDRVGWLHWFGGVTHELPTEVVLGLQSHDDYVSKKVLSYRGWRYINANLASNARILTFNDENFFAERQKISDYAIPVRRAVWDEPRRSEAEARECLRQERITHVLFDKRRQSELLHERVPIARASFVERWFVREYEDEYFILYRLRED